MIPCPACRENSGAVAYVISAADVGEALCRGEGRGERYERLKSAANALWGGNTCAVRRCLACGFHHADPFVAGDKAFYELAYGAGEYPAWKWEYEQTRRTLERLVAGGAIQAGFTLIEVGAGNGAFLAEISPRLTPTERVVGTEFSPAGIEKIRQRGFAATPSDLAELEARGGNPPFQAACLFQVLEHLAQTDELFARLGRLTSADAHLFLSVPNARQRILLDRMGVHEDVPPIHVSRWTRASLEAVAARNGWVLLEDATEPESFGSKLLRLARGCVNSSSFGGRVNDIAGAGVRRPLKAVAAILMVCARWRGVLELRAPDCGLAYWAHLRKRPKTSAVGARV